MDNGKVAATYGKIANVGCLLPILAVITSLADIRTALQEDSRIGERFEVRATVDFATHHFSFHRYSAGDGQTSVSFCSGRVGDLKAGDVAVLSGRMERESYGNHPIALVTGRKVLGRARPLPPTPVTSRQLRNAAFEHRPVQITGELIDVVRDDIDNENMFLVLQDEDGRLVVACAFQKPDQFQKLVGARISLRGIPSATATGTRRLLDPLILSNGFPDMTVLAPPPDDPFGVPNLDALNVFTSADALSRMGRRSVRGVVLAVRRPHVLLVRSDSGRIVRVTLRQGNGLPSAGTRVAAVGLPETDAFTINLASAAFRPEKGGNELPIAKPTDVSGDVLLSNDQNARRRQLWLHGSLLRIRGKVLGTSTRHADGDTLNLLCDGRNLLVDSGCCPAAALDLPSGSIVEITGVGAVETESATPSPLLPCVRGLTVVLRSENDLRILSTPSWWTAGRLIGVIAGLVILLLVIFLWNRLLQRLIRRRSGELARMELAKATSDLRIDERTRLAVELHDSLSQSLTVIGYQISTAQKTLGEKDPETSTCLITAAKMIHSCRTDLRRCLWDLRNDVLDEPDFATAIRKTVEPVADEAIVQIRFVGRRMLLTDSTAHALLNIIRELVANAIRHGRATAIHIAGEVRPDILHVSVRDNGCGFDISSRPGQDEGHFGIDGIKERIERLQGSFELSSTPSKGTYARITIEKDKKTDTQP